jgi:hypothetical protein
LGRGVEDELDGPWRQVTLDDREEVLEVERLEENGISVGVRKSGAGGGKPGQDHNRKVLQMAVLERFPEELGTAHDGHHPVQQDQLREWVTSEVVQGRRAAVDTGCVVAVHPEKFGQGVAEVSAIVNDENTSWDWPSVHCLLSSLFR